MDRHNNTFSWGVDKMVNLKTNFGSDDISIGKLNLKQANFGMVYKVENLTQKTDFSGVLGLAQGDQIATFPSLLAAAVANKTIKANEWGLAIDAADKAHLLVLGGMDATIADAKTLQLCDATKLTYTCDATKDKSTIMVDKKAIDVVGLGEVSFSTVALKSSLPADFFKALGVALKDTKGCEVKTTGLTCTDVKTIDDLTLTIGKGKVVIPTKDLFTLADKVYTFNFEVSADKNSVLGLDFFAGKYVSFDADLNQVKWGAYVVKKSVSERHRHGIYKHHKHNRTEVEDKRKKHHNGTKW